jgi:hypothetical protein
MSLCDLLQISLSRGTDAILGEFCDLQHEHLTFDGLQLARLSAERCLLALLACCASNAQCFA